MNIATLVLIIYCLLVIGAAIVFYAACVAAARADRRYREMVRSRQSSASATVSQLDKAEET